MPSHQRQHLQQQIEKIKALEETEQTKYDSATTRLAAKKAAYDVSEMGSRVSGRPLTESDFQGLGNALANAVDEVTSAMGSLGKLQKQRRELEDSLLMLPE